MDVEAVKVVFVETRIRADRAPLPLPLPTPPCVFGSGVGRVIRAFDGVGGEIGAAVTTLVEAGGRFVRCRQRMCSARSR
ncbi:hypothetical protein [Streptomyces viridochromogenes]|uniref:hypothetical protein n=1 Tax=Streptomyces viridochromogenes TaxID=1938 RepID=UPI0002F4FC47|nr:hypothetical protein [Streptomyces viridochromogenes]